jgi:hypothetical protein
VKANTDPTGPEQSTVTPGKRLNRRHPKIGTEVEVDPDFGAPLFYLRFG